jgi:hypothetical protein
MRVNKYCKMLIILSLLISQIAFGWRDPTEPPLAFKIPGLGGQNKYGLLLTSIIHSSNRRVATINGQGFVEKEKVGNYVILKINPSSVSLKSVNSGKVIELPITHDLEIQQIKIQ